MRLFGVFRKSLREQLRELWLVALLLCLAPFFIALYYVVFGGGWNVYKAVVVNHDEGIALADGTRWNGGEELAQALEAARAPDGTAALEVTRVADAEDARRLLERASAHALFEISPGFSQALAEARETGRASAQGRLVYSGDLTSQAYLVTAVIGVTAAQTWIEGVVGRPGPIGFEEVALGGSGGRTELEVFIPGLFVFAVILLIFPTSMALARETESGTLRRLRLTRMTAFDLLGGISLLQVCIGVVAVCVAYATAWAFGFRSEGPLWVAVLVTVLSSFACIGVGLVVAGLSRSVTEAFLVGNFPLILLMFFSGAMIPIPKIPVLTVGSVVVGATDVLPTTHAVNAMNKVLGLGLGFGDVLYELGMLVALSALFFAGGVLLFQKRRMGPEGSGL